MLIHFTRLAMFYPCLLLCLFLPLLAVGAANGGGGPRNVLVLRNLDSSVSVQIANYYITKRHIPPENVCDIHATASELITQAQCVEQMVEPIRAFLKNPAVSERIDYIVMTKGMPLAADYGWSSGRLSVASILTCVGEPTVTQYLRNPYGPMALYPVETSFSHKLTLEGRRLYLVTRLDAYTKEEVFKMIDRSAAAYSGGAVMLDSQVQANLSPSYRLLNAKIQKANTVLGAKGIPVIYDETSNFIGGGSNLIGYFSWGSNDSSYTLSAYKSNTFAPGSIADTFVSSSARTFYPASSGQSLMADLITCGACGVCGYVSEPYTTYTTFTDVLFDRYTKGYNMAESFHAAMPELFWKAVVVGDPLMAPFATPPVVSVNVPGEPLTGPEAMITANASDLSGVSKIDFFCDGHYIGTSAAAPFSVVFDTTVYCVGSHRVDVVAYENSLVATQGFATAAITISNPVSVLTRVSDSFHSADGQAVRSPSMIVTAGTGEMGGGEFYIQDASGAGGIRVISDAAVEEGDRVTVAGQMTTESGERSISASDVVIDLHQKPSILPFCMSNKNVGGGDFCQRTKGVTNGKGLRNIGLLVKTLGRVTYVGNADQPFFYVDDGSNLRDRSGNLGLRVLCRDISKPLPGSYVSVTGISSCYNIDKCVAPVLKARTPRDIHPITLPL